MFAIAWRRIVRRVAKSAAFDTNVVRVKVITYARSGRPDKEEEAAAVTRAAERVFALIARQRASGRGAKKT